MKGVLLSVMVMGVLLATMPAAAVEMGKLPIKLDASAGFAYDTNVNLRSSEHSVSKYQQNGCAGMYKQQANLGYDLALTKELGMLLQYSYYQEFHFNLSPYDALSHNVTVTPTLRLFNNSGQVVGMFNYNYLDIGSDKYKVAYTVNPTYFQMFTKKAMLEVGVKFERGYYYAPVTIQQDDRSAHSYGANVGLYYFINDARTALLSVRFIPLYNITAGTNFNGASYSFIGGTQIPITKELTVQANFTFTTAPYYNTWVNAAAPFDPNFINPKRQDYFVEGSLYATYQIYQGLYGQVQFLATHASSNIGVYAYDRYLIGGMLGYRYN